MQPHKVVEMEPGHKGKSEVLVSAIISIIASGQFGDMTVAEVVGSLELVKFRLFSALEQDSNS